MVLFPVARQHSEIAARRFVSSADRSTPVTGNHTTSMAGKTVLITGAGGGIGRATAKGLAAMGAHLAITGRDRRRLESAAEELRAAGGEVLVFVADLSSQAQVRRLADEVLAIVPRIDVLINNAYNQSKLANVLFAYELARRLGGTSVTANALHPGLVSTSFGAEAPGNAQRLLVPILRPFMKTPAGGAATSVYVASAPELRDVSGRYFARCRARRSTGRSYDTTVAARLWRTSAGLAGLIAAS
jgi:NAD(P)-dependent dehydrogenase (short-subunit alcohol dehydrogenase family)